MAVTLADVAARAGVSAATVSRVLNGNYPVARTTRSRVMRAVEELEYVVNGPASSLAAARSDLIGVLVNDIADPFFGIMASAIQNEISPVTGAGGGGAAGAAASGAGAGGAPGGGEGAPGQKLAVVCNTGGVPERELTYLTLLQRQRAAAVVLTGGAIESPAHSAALAVRLRRLERAGARVVLCGRPPLPVPEPEGGAQGAESAMTGPDRSRGADAEAGQPIAVTFDNRGGARTLTEHLLSLGHRRLGYLAGPADRTTTRHRLEGHRAALADAGLDATEAAGDRLILHGGYDRASGYDGALELLRRDPGVTAVLAANDTAALGVCAALRDRGLRIPEDISVTGFDDLPFAADAAPALTTVRIPLHDAGARAGRLALGLEAPPAGGIATIRSELMVRASTAPPSRRTGG
ncbi:LacI family DNA-binding transcriptional regulator [Streptomyces aidingensis]|uniref:LacI family transcriptional regulator n=1 Tax=Streptomyces aidingensis TaxID=910347 RepID=A0A1I1F3C5_9ACTN|nr:LacI family DNA-binding transcriptional regulator [Streptomyces aidingensis]SFB93442.1 LacI family transcriptional regulator [Streptomyces aidingensis]